MESSTLSVLTSLSTMAERYQNMLCIQLIEFYSLKTGECCFLNLKDVISCLYPHKPSKQLRPVIFFSLFTFV